MSLWKAPSIIHGAAESAVHQPGSQHGHRRVKLGLPCPLPGSHFCFLVFRSGANQVAVEWIRNETRPQANEPKCNAYRYLFGLTPEGRCVGLDVTEPTSSDATSGPRSKWRRLKIHCSADALCHQDPPRVRPAVRLGKVGIVVVNESKNAVGQVVNRRERHRPGHLSLKRSVPNFNLIQPRTMARSIQEPNVMAGVCQKCDPSFSRLQNPALALLPQATLVINALGDTPNQ